MSQNNIVCSVINGIVKFYCGLFSHPLSALKFQSNFPLDKKERENITCSNVADNSTMKSL